MRVADRAPQALTTLAERNGGGPVAALLRWSQMFEAEDKRYLRELKSILREGIIVFESLERDSARTGGDRLLAALRAIPQLLAAYNERLAPHALELEGVLEPVEG